jgi:hypothetical protein
VTVAPSPSRLAAAVFLIAVTASGAEGVKAQAAEPTRSGGAAAAGLRPGDRIRIRHQLRGGFVGTVTALEGGMLRIRSAEGDLVALPTGWITRLERSRGVEEGGRKPVVVGAASGAVLGGFLAGAAWSPPTCRDHGWLTHCSRSGFSTHDSRGEAIVMGAVIGMLFGGALGRKPRERWTRVPWPPSGEGAEGSLVGGRASVAPDGALEFSLRIGIGSR